MQRPAGLPKEALLYERFVVIEVTKDIQNLYSKWLLSGIEGFKS